MKLNLSIFLLVFLYNDCFPQWKWQNPYPQGNDLSSLHVFNDSTIITVGYPNLVLKTENNGKDWNILQNAGDMNRQLYDICFVDDSVGWAVGNNLDFDGTIIKSYDGGKNWVKQEIYSQSTFLTLHFVDRKYGWIGGDLGAAFSTDDGGENWESRLRMNVHIIEDIFFQDSLNGWFVGVQINDSAVVHRTTDGGRTWKYSKAHFYGWGTSICFIDSNNGWISGILGSIAKTTDGGKSWSSSRTGGVLYLSDIIFINDSSGWATSGTYNYGENSGILYYSNDSGNTWKQRNSPEVGRLTKIHFSSDSTGWAVGQYGSIIRTNNGGKTWEAISKGTRYGINDVTFTSENIGWAVGEIGTVLKSVNFGKSWEPINIGSYQKLNGVHFINENLGFIVGSNGTMFKTVNNGNDWSKVEMDPKDDIKSIQFADKYKGWFNTYNSIYSSHDGGNTWAIDSLDTLVSDYVNINAIKVVGSNSIFAICSDGIILKYDFMEKYWGANFISTSIIPANFVDMEFINDSEIILITDNGLILKSIDNGNTWHEKYKSSGKNFKSISFIDDKKGWTVGNYGIIISTLDGGETWVEEISPTSLDLNKVYNYEKFLWIIGQNGAILQRDISNLVSVEIPNKTVPKSIILSQNYPNPFNPTTTINYSIPNSSVILSEAKNLKDFSSEAPQNDNVNVVLRVFDILGREVATLVNQNQKPGYYKLEFDASKLTSGVYFYQLNAGDFIESKKMLLLK